MPPDTFACGRALVLGRAQLWRLGCAVLVGLFVLAPAAVRTQPAEEAALLRGARVAAHTASDRAHTAYDRMVLDFDGSFEVLGARWISDNAIEIDLAASVPETGLGQRFELARISGLQARPALHGVRVRVELRVAKTGGPRPRVRVFPLDGPERLVLDAAPAGPAAFAVPGGVQAILLSPVAPAEPAPAVARARPLPSKSSDAPPLAVENPENPSLAPADSEQPTPAHTASAPMPPASPPPPPSKEARPGNPIREVIDPAIFGERWVFGALVAAAALLLVAFAWRRRRAKAPLLDSEETQEPRAPESITPAEIRAAGDRIDVLEKRIDEEVRARVEFEARVVEIQEHVKVLGDRVRRSFPPPARSVSLPAEGPPKPGADETPRRVPR